MGSGAQDRGLEKVFLKDRLWRVEKKIITIVIKTTEHFLDN